MLLLAAAALVMPAIFELVEGKGLPLPGAEIVDYGSTVEQLSLAVAIVLIAVLRRRAALLAEAPTATSSTRQRRRGRGRGRAVDGAPVGRRCSRSPASRSA